MIISHHKFTTPQTASPNDVYQWIREWHGCHRLLECKSIVANKRYQKALDIAHNSGRLGEREMEVDCFLSIVADIRNEKATFMELGAGYGEWCLALTGVIKNQIIPTAVETTQCYAIEAEPTHKDWCKIHFDAYKILGRVIWGAVSNYDGDCKFSILSHPADNYGQSITVGNGLLRTISNITRHKAVTVPCFTLDTLVKNQNISHIDLIHMDVQGAENRVVDGAMRTIKAGKIDCWVIGTHGRRYNDILLAQLTPYYECILNLYPNSVNSRVICQDGIQVYKRRGM